MWPQEILNRVFEAATNRLRVSAQSPELETKVDILNNKVDTLGADIKAIKDTAGIKKITDPVGIDPTNNTVQLSGSNLKEATTVNVLVAGTRVQLPDLVCSQVMIIAKRGNTGYIYVGGDDVSATVYGADLGELDCVVLPVSNTNEIYIDASVSGEGISYVAV